jgi:hypothetical protein
MDDQVKWVEDQIAQFEKALTADDYSKADKIIIEVKSHGYQKLGWMLAKALLDEYADEDDDSGGRPV